MTPVYQTIFDDKRGNCMQACTASILDLPLESVPNFIDYRDWRGEMFDFFLKHGYRSSKEYNGQMQLNNFLKWYWDSDAEMEQYDENYAMELLDENLSINGFYMAAVYSPRFFDPVKKTGMHQVICDREFKIVHDPVPFYKGVKYPMTDHFGSILNGITMIDVFDKI